MPGKHLQLRYRITILALIVWSCFVAASWWWNSLQLQDRTLEMARAMARTGVDRDLSMINWAASLSGIYVPASELSPPNPYLVSQPAHEISSKIGLLTLMNPEYILRLSASEYVTSVQGHFTSLELKNPLNMPDPWENSALQSFRLNAREIDSQQVIAGKPYLRLIRPVFAEKKCNKCHGTRAGEMMGAISVEVALDPIRLSLASSAIQNNLGHGLVWFAGLGLIGLGFSRSEITSKRLDWEARCLLQDRNLFNQALDKVSTGVVVFDADNKPIFTNQAANILFKGNVSEALLHGTIVEHALQQGQEIHGRQAKFSRLDGSILHVECWLSPVIDAGKAKWMLSFVDIGEKIESDQRIRRLSRDLEKKAAAQSNEYREVCDELDFFCHALNHETREPLRAIDGYAQILAEDYGRMLEQKGTRLIKEIRKNVASMLQLLDGMLQIRSAGSRKLQFTDVDMEHLAKEVFDEMNYSERTVEFSLQQLPKAWGDLEALRQVLTILFDNALKFTRERGNAVIEMGCKKHQGENIYFIRDNGSGFDMQYAKSLFSIFNRLHAENEFEGKGVGLAIVKRLVKRHRGRVWAWGKVDSGAVIYFSLPEK